MDLGTQDCIIGIKWLRRFQLRLDTSRNRIVWPAKYPLIYDPAPPIFVQLKQPSIDADVERDIQRRDALWEKDNYRRQNSPRKALMRRIRGCLKLPKVRLPLPVPDPTPDPIRPISSPRIAIISANAFHYSMKRKENEFFTISIYEINRILEERMKLDDPENAKLVRDRLLSAYYSYRDVFSKIAAELLPEHRPYDYKISTEELEATKTFVMENLRKGHINLSHCPFASPVLCVRKPNGDIRICVDYRRLNAITRKDAYPIPRIDELLARTHKAKIFTKLDIRAAFNKI
ncbi:uncharacterized protein yc1106_10160 [Curvularia clavata]|uniref:Reverse transcriptase domain-containing protein n=1 Tax=Curvularia clavata TaxID=95742 RepID=A0A9Q8ZGC0_CURCL|nr:uncharacterized protein yc1106_10160 [Curvularia clavata]